MMMILLFQCRQEDVVLNKTLLYVVSLVCYLLWAVSLSPLPHRLDVDGDLSFFFLLSSLSSLSSLLQPEDGMVRMQSPLKLQIRAAATLLIALPCFKMSVCESVNKPLLAGREHNCTSRASLCKTAPKCKQAHKAARRFVTVRGWWLWFELKGISWLELRFKAAYVSPFLCQDRSPTDFCCRVLFFFSTQVFIVSLGRQQHQAQFCQRQWHAVIKSSMWGIKSRNRETNRPELEMCFIREENNMFA